MGKFYEGQYDELSLYVRQLAWLNTVPEKREHSRLQALQAEGRDPDLPEADLSYLAEYLLEIGPVLRGGAQPTPVTHQEIQSWQELTGIALQPWEVRFIRRLSHEYLAQVQTSVKPSAPPPWQPGATQERTREVVARKVQNAMRAFMQARGKQ